MPIAIVVALEEIHIEQDHGERYILGGALRNGTLARLIEVATVGYAGQGIPVSHGIHLVCQHQVVVLP